MQIADFTKPFETLVLFTYDDAHYPPRPLQTGDELKGTATIGWGCTNAAYTVPGAICTKEQADIWLAEDIAAAQQHIDSLVTAPLNTNQNIAVTDFVFNLGSGRLQGSTLLKLLNANDYTGASGQFERWCYAGGYKSEGLLRRRLAERDLFLS